MSHEFMRDALTEIGLPVKYVDALKMFYKDNVHWFKCGGQLLKSIILHNGVRQGCPLSPLLFALCAD
eukprot:9239644-Karenia_brevis.AAC.1